MKLFKNSIRYVLASLSRDLGISESVRAWYLRTASNYLKSFKFGIQQGWARRSVTNKDFVPFLSDIDLTLIVEEASIQQLQFPPSLLVKDIQLIPKDFLAEWLETGGFRNNLQHEWIPLKNAIRLPKKSLLIPRTQQAFELSHEIYLLYHQLEKNLHEFPDSLTINSLKKIQLDIEKIKSFWIKPSEEILSAPRESFKTTFHLDVFMLEFDQFCKDLLKHLDAPLNQFDCLKLVTEKHPYSVEIKLDFLGKPVMVVLDIANFSKVLGSFPKHFVATESFINLAKGVGVQEQTLLNTLAQDKASYYFKFNKQRLALDLVGAVALAPENHGQLYYCFKNIHDFAIALTGTEGHEWDKIHKLWEQESLAYKSTADLYSLMNAYLEVLKALG